MGQQLLINLGQGSWQTGFNSITTQLWQSNQKPIQFIGSLPPAPHLEAQYQQWQQLYTALYVTQTNWRRSATNFDFDTTELTNVSQQTFETLCITLKTDLNQWLMTAKFSQIERRIRTQLPPQDDIRVMLTAHEEKVLRFPWRLWHLFEDYPQAELSLSLPDYSRSLKQTASPKNGTVKILAVLGNDDGIDIETDQQILEQLPNAQVTLLTQPTLTDLQHHLWESPWDILFFAGHSSSQGQGCLQVNLTETLTIEQLKYALRRAIAKGLQLAILNSCDGLGLAWDLADLHLPQTIVMREPVPDAIAQQFLKAFLTQLASGQALYSAVREAREKLHGLTALGTCASWLPIIVQNPAEEPPTWQTLRGQESLAFTTTSGPTPRQPSFPNSKTSASPPASPTSINRDTTHQSSIAKAVAPPPPLFPLLSILSVTAILLLIRWLGLLQGIELWAYDILMKHRPHETVDPRLIVVTIDERDIQAQDSLERRGSLSDQTLQQILSILTESEARIIGIDLYRDFATDNITLAKTLAQPNIIGICKSRDPIADDVGIGPTPEIANSQVGFSDFIEDSDGLLRRQILTLTSDPVSPCTSPYGFAALTAIHYLSHEGIQPTFTAQGNLQLGDTVLPRLNKRTGGLQRMDHRGNQLLLNYRALPAPEDIAATISLQQLLDGQVNPASLRDRIVLLGVIAPSGGDYWSTPYGKQAQTRTPGIFIQAHMISQLISAVQEDRPLIWVWPPWLEALCIGAAALFGSLLVTRWHSSRLGLTCLLIGGGIILSAWATLLVGGWIPWIPTLIAFGSGSVATSLTQWQSYSRQNTIDRTQGR